MKYDLQKDFTPNLLIYMYIYNINQIYIYQPGIIFKIYIYLNSWGRVIITLVL